MSTWRDRYFQPYFTEWLVTRYFQGRWVLYLAGVGIVWWALVHWG